MKYGALNVFPLENTTCSNYHGWGDNVINTFAIEGDCIGFAKTILENHKELIPQNGFVKPQHKLLNLLNDISSSDKIYLMNVTDKESFTSKTIERDLSDLVNHIMKKVINSINGVSELDLFTKDIEQI